MPSPLRDGDLTRRCCFGQSPDVFNLPKVFLDSGSNDFGIVNVLALAGRTFLSVRSLSPKRRFGYGERPDRNGRPARARALTIPKSSDPEPRKTLARLIQTARTKTDTGRRDEYSKALERTLVKELGKLTP